LTKRKFGENKKTNKRKSIARALAKGKTKKVARSETCPNLVNDTLISLPKPLMDENVYAYTNRLILILKQIPVEVALPPCLLKEHNRLFERYEALKTSKYAPFFEELKHTQLDFIQPLYKQIFRAAKNTIR
jgi:hypothetical protein